MTQYYSFIANAGQGCGLTQCDKFLTYTKQRLYL